MHEVEVSVSAENIPEGREVQISPEKIKVSVKCEKTDAQEGKISATINAEDLDETDKTVNVTVTAEENIDVIGEYTVSAKLL
jgi:YbbR domain-containing protein